MLDSESIEELVRSPLIELGAHTHSHYILSQLPAAAQEIEIRKSLDLVESHTGEPCYLFAYPNGKKRDYDNKSLAILRKHGVKAALTTESGTCNSDSPRLELRRVSVSAEANLSSFKLSLFDIPGRIKRFLNRKKT